MSPRRIMCLVFPDLACEIATLRRESRLGVANALTLSSPLGVVIGENEEEIRANSPLYAVTARAQRLGVCAGQTVSAARALVHDLDIRRVAPSEIESTLARLAELAMSWGPTVSFSMPDTVWVDITGSAHLAGGEDTLLTEACERARSLGHRVRGAIATGPRITRAIARSSSAPRTVVPAGHDRHALAPLPAHALSLGDAIERWLMKLGVLTVGDLARQPRGPLAARLGDRSSEILGLLEGEDDAPLVAYVPPRRLHEKIDWDDPVEGVEPLLFALRGVLARICARLEGRGEAIRDMTLALTYDRSLAERAGVDRVHELRFDFPAAFSRPDELLRVARARLEATTLAAPVRGLSVSSAQICEAPRTQLDLEGGERSFEHVIPSLVAELTAEFGDDGVGLLEPTHEHLPEEASKLSRFSAQRTTRASSSPKDEQLSLWPTRRVDPPTRLLPTPLPIQGSLVQDGFLTIEGAPYHVRRVSLAERLDEVAWWTESAPQRDYARVWLDGAGGVFEAWVLRDRKRRKMFLHGWYA